MDCVEFKLRFDGYDTGRAGVTYGDPLHEAWCDHFHNCKACGDWALAKRVMRSGHDPTDYPCIHMAYHATQTCDQHPDRAECHDLFVERGERDGAFYLIKGQVRLKIQHCPWCGVDVSPSGGKKSRPLDA
ncbi:MAG: DUF6980 family protein [Hyphomicrobium sp.]